MVRKQSIKVDFQRNIKLIISPLFEQTVNNRVLPYTLDNWGAMVMLELKKEIDNRILRLYLMPNANPKSKDIDSTKTTIYRNIILKKYPFIIVYSVRNFTVTILNIISTSKGTKERKNLIKQGMNK